jgi:hypothetical protein
MPGVVHEVPGPRKTPPAAAHCACVVCSQRMTPAWVMQQAPVGAGAGQVFAPQVVPLP